MGTLGSTWLNRSPLGNIPLGDVEHRSASNPAGWFFDPTLDFRDAQGLRTRFMTYAKTTIPILQSMKAQGCIFMGLGGFRFGEVGYLGSPELATTINPEISETLLVDFLKPYKNSGFKVGCELRPLEVDFVTRKARTPQSYYQNLRMKMRYARSVLGMTIFYVDTNMEDLGAGPVLAAGVFERLYAEFSDCLIIPEYGDESGTIEDYYRSTAPLLMGNRDECRTPERVLANYPDGFSVINVNGKGGTPPYKTSDIFAKNSQAFNERKGRDIVWCNAGWDGDEVASVRAFYGL